MMRTLVVAMMLASASSFAPSPKTQLATRRPAQAAPRVMPAMKLEPGNPLYYIGFPSQYQKDDMIREVCPYHYAPLWNPIASLGLLASLELAPGVPPSPPWSSSPPWTPAPLEPLASLEPHRLPGAPRLPGARPWSPSPPWSTIASLKPHPLQIPSLELAPAICAVTNTTISQSPVTLSTTSVSAQANKKEASDFFLVVCILTGFVCGELYLMF